MYDLALNFNPKVLIKMNCYCKTNLLKQTFHSYYKQILEFLLSQ